MKYFRLLTGIILMMISMIIWASCDNDCPTCPKEPQPPSAGHYRLYAFNGMSANGLLMSIDVPADTIVDSVRLDYSGADIFVTPDGQRLLVMRIYNSTTAMEIYRTSDLAHLGTSDQYGYYYFDGGDNYAIFAGSSVCFIDPATLVPIDTVIQADMTGYLDTVANQFFVEGANATIYKIDCQTRSIIDSFPNMYGGNIMDLAYNRLTNDIYYFTQVNYYLTKFVQYSCDLDSVMSVTFLSGWSGDIALSPDCKRVYVTDGGNGMLGVMPPGQIWVFDAMTHNVLAWIPNYNATTGKVIPSLFGQFLITPDNQRAYIGEPWGGGGASPVPVVDLNTNRIIKTIVPDTQSFEMGATFLVLGKAPEN